MIDLSDFDGLWSEERRPITEGPRVLAEQFLFDGDNLVETIDGIPFTGVAYEMFPDGSLKSEDEYFEGLLSGRCRHWYESGQLEVYTFVWHEAGHGPCISWYPNGNLKSWSWSELGVPIELKNWDENGKVIDYKKRTDGDEWSNILKVRKFKRGLLYPTLPSLPNAPVLDGEDLPY